MTVRPYDTDPPSLNRFERGPSLFDKRRIMDAMARGLVEGIPFELDYPTDALLAATAVSLGMPAWVADQVRGNPQFRLNLLELWCAVGYAAKGDRQAKERVDLARQAFDEFRKTEWISDRPEGSVGIGER